MTDFTLFIDYITGSLVPALWSLIIGNWLLSLFVLIAIMSWIVSLLNDVKGVR